ncbi:ATP-binding protein [Paucibacter sp. APW11]|uniref:histidine kinase n=1 Tax=Roseateles aquae TaxID=3077235 RepID=A0ABU3P9H7_9BURK|nr:ATP-binding protein [Paucibacter sp. APW11]MDT8999228.1 ATP-binding protein [Paucibacter sp. APW11]
MSLLRPRPTERLNQLLLRRVLVLTSLQLLLGLLAVWLLLAPELERQAGVAMQTAAESIAKRLIAQVAQADSSVQSAAQLLASGRSGDAQLEQAVLNMVSAQSPAIVSSYLLNSDGIVRAMSSKEAAEAQRQQQIGMDLSRSPVFAMRSRAGGGFSEPYLSTVGERLTVAAVHDAGTSGLMIGELSLAVLSRELGQAAGESGFSAMIIDAQGRVIAHRDALAAQRSVQLSVQQLQELEQETGLKPLRMDERDWLAVSSSVLQARGLGWRLLILQPREALLRPVRQVVIGAIVIGLLMVSVLMAVALGFGRRLAAIASRLADHADELAAGRVLPPKVQGIEEFDRLIEHLDAMAKAVKERELALQQLNAGLEEKVSLRTQSLEQTLAQLKETQDELIHSGKLAALGSLVANVAHELNTPIGNALMAATTVKEGAAQFSENLQAGKLTRSQASSALEHLSEGANIVERNLYRAATLVRSFKQVAVDQTSEQHRPFELATVLKEIATLVSPTLNKTRAELRCSAADEIEMEGYPGPLGQVLTNLVENAALHGLEAGAGVIEVEGRLLDADTVELRVRDHGKGMDEATLQRIFDPFFTTRRQHGGTGLGMTIVHNLVSGILRGQISVQSQPGEGTEFSVRLPRVIAAPEH